LNGESTQCQHQEPLPNEPLNDGEMNVRCHRTWLADADHQVERLKNSIKSLLRVLSWFDVCAQRFCRNAFTPERFGCQFGPPRVIRPSKSTVDFHKGPGSAGRLLLTIGVAEHWPRSRRMGRVSVLARCFMLISFPLFGYRVRTANAFRRPGAALRSRTFQRLKSAGLSLSLPTCASMGARRRRVILLR